MELILKNNSADGGKMEMQKIGLTRENFTNIVNNGGKITFTPLKRNKLKCNQIPGLTRLSSRQAETLRRQFGAMRRDLIQASKPTFFSRENLPKSRRDSWGDAQCPNCKDWCMGVKTGQVASCNSFGCTGRFMVI